MGSHTIVSNLPQEKNPKVAGEIRLNLNNQQLVKISRPFLRRVDDDAANDIWVWHTTDILSGQYFALPEDRLGSYVFNEMEVLAWVAV